MIAPGLASVGRSTTDSEAGQHRHRRRRDQNHQQLWECLRQNVESDHTAQHPSGSHPCHSLSLLCLRTRETSAPPRKVIRKLDDSLGQDPDIHLSPQAAPAKPRFPPSSESLSSSSGPSLSPSPVAASTPKETVKVSTEMEKATEHLSEDFRKIVVDVVNAEPVCTKAEAIITNTNRTPVETIPQRPYRLSTIEAGPKPLPKPGQLYGNNVIDPRTMFTGVPSSVSDQFSFLRDIRFRSIRHGQYEVKYYPIGVSAITKQERAVLPDGTIYQLNTTWVADPHYTMGRETATQTGGNVKEADTQTEWELADSNVQTDTVSLISVATQAICTTTCDTTCQTEASTTDTRDTQTEEEGTATETTANESRETQTVVKYYVNGAAQTETDSAKDISITKEEDKSVNCHIINMLFNLE